VSWQQVDAGGFIQDSFVARQSPALAFDANRSRLIVFGGDRRNRLRANDTWEYLGPDWSRVDAGVAPIGRRYFGHAYDTSRNRLVVFGGDTDSTVLDDTTWELGTSWARLGAGGPSARYFHGMAYDAARRRVVLFGGLRPLADGGAPETLGDTWTWDGSAWTNVSPPGSPSARQFMALGYDPIRMKVVMFGGYDSNQDLLDETWEWNGSTWTEVRTQVRPPPGNDVAFAFDPAQRRLVLTGYFNPGGGARTFEWDGMSWLDCVDQSTPPRLYPGFAYDPTQNSVVLFGGYLFNNTKADDLWVRRR
jgi:hypothetical protein